MDCRVPDCEMQNLRVVVSMIPARARDGALAAYRPLPGRPSPVGERSPDLWRPLAREPPHMDTDYGELAGRKIGARFIGFFSCTRWHEVVGSADQSHRVDEWSVANAVFHRPI